jgi:thiamine-phosphate diphosphorylase
LTSATGSWERRIAEYERRTALLSGIYVIVNDGPRAVEIAEAALDSGVRAVQYRAKSGVDERRLKSLRRLAQTALLVLDDDWRSAREFGCDGVHLGPGDDGFDDPAAVRVAWPSAIIGISCGNEDEARAAELAGADYLGIGPVYRTFSKEDAGEPIGIDALRRIASVTRLPVAAIGGITSANLGEVRRSGVAMAAVISALSEAAEPRNAAAQLIAIWERQ